MDQSQAYLLQLKKANRGAMRSSIRPDLYCYPLPDARPVFVISNPAPAFPAPGAAAVVVLTYTVPPGFFTVFNKLAIMLIGGNIVDFTGNVVWRVLINDAGVKGLEALVAQVGTNAAPNDIQPIPLWENDVISITAEVPAGQPAQPVGNTTAARLHGFQMPIQKALNRPQQ